jgi:hypothetical protein
MLKYKIRKKNVNVEKKQRKKKEMNCVFISWWIVKVLLLLVYTITNTHTPHSLLLNSAKFNQLVQINYVYESWFNQTCIKYFF